MSCGRAFVFAGFEGIPGHEAVERVYRGTNAFLTGQVEGRLFIDMSTVSHSVAYPAYWIAQQRTGGASPLAGAGAQRVDS